MVNMLVCTYHIVVAKDVYFSWYLIGRYFRKSTISIRKVMTINLLKHTTNKTEIHKEHLFSQGAVNKVLHFFWKYRIFKITEPFNPYLFQYPSHIFACSYVSVTGQTMYSSPRPHMACVNWMTVRYAKILHSLPMWYTERYVIKKIALVSRQAQFYKAWWYIEDNFKEIKFTFYDNLHTVYREQPRH